MEFYVLPHNNFGEVLFYHLDFSANFSVNLEHIFLCITSIVIIDALSLCKFENLVSAFISSEGQLVCCLLDIMNICCKNSVFYYIPLKSAEFCYSFSHQLISVQFSSCLTLCDPMNCSTPGLPVHHQLPEFTQTHVH